MRRTGNSTIGARGAWENSIQGILTRNTNSKYNIFRINTCGRTKESYKLVYLQGGIIQLRSKFVPFCPIIPQNRYNSYFNIQCIIQLSGYFDPIQVATRFFRYSYLLGIYLLCLLVNTSFFFIHFIAVCILFRKIKR